jgi:PAS domain S-box-containing protein
MSDDRRASRAVEPGNGDSLSASAPRLAVAGAGLQSGASKTRPPAIGAPPAQLLSPAARRLSALLGICLAAGALAIGLSGPRTSDMVIRAIANALAIAAPVAVGLYALRRDAANRFARLLVVAGLAWAPSALTMSSESVPYSIGRVWAWGVVAWLVYLLLTFPTGRLPGRAERLVVGGAALVLATLYVPSALVAEFPSPSPWSDCVSQCPRNAFMVVSSQPSWMSTIFVLRDALTAATYTAAAVIILLRCVRGSRIERRLYGPVLAIALVNFLADLSFVIARRAAPEAEATEALGLAALLVEPLLAVGFLAGLLRLQFVVLSTWRGLAPDDGDLRASRGIHSLLAAAIDDPTLEIGYWSGDERGWIDEDGRPFAMPPTGSRRTITVVPGHGEPVAILVHDASPLAESVIREVVRGIALLALENQRLEGRARASLRDLAESRARILATIDKERLRIERDLHDGAQQRLIAMMVAAEHGVEGSDAQPERVTQLFRRIGNDANAALDEVRTLAHGVFPPLLADFGLVTALKEVARGSAVPTVVRARGIGRYPQEVEAAVYFCCVEAVQNAQKHADASGITVSLSATDRLQFAVRDNGRGFQVSDAMPASGLANMRDRVAAVGGTLRIDSVVAGGTRVAGTVPMVMAHVPVEIEHLALQATEVLEDALGIYRAVRTASGKVVDFAVEYVNDAACRMVGLSREAQVGKTLGQLHPGYIGSSAFDWHRQALEASTPLVREESEYASTPSGHRLQEAYDVRAAALGAGRLALVWREITDRKRAEHQLRLRAEAVASEAGAVCIVRSATGMVAYANTRFEEMLGYQAGELEGRLVSEFDRTDSRLDFGAHGQRRFESVYRQKGGTLIRCEVLVEGFDDPDLGWCWVATHRDVTPLREEQDSLEAESERLRSALHGLPLLAYSADPDLHCTVLVDGLIEPGGREAWEGDDVDLFGQSLAEAITEVNRRVLVTRRGARVEAHTDLPQHPTVVLVVDPVLNGDGDVVGLAGSVIDRMGLSAERGATPAPRPVRSSRAR